MISVVKKIASNYWMNKIKDNSVLNDGPLQLSESKKHIIKKEQLAYFLKLARGNESAEFIILLTLFNVLVNRYFDLTGFVFSPRNNEQTSPALYQLITTKGKTIKACINVLKEEVQEVYKHLDYDERLLDKFSFDNYASFKFSYQVNTSKIKSSIPFSLSIQKTDKGLELTLYYDACFIEKHLAHHFLENFKTWLPDLENLIDRQAHAIPIVSKTEKKQLLEAFNNSKIGIQKNETLTSLFEKQVARTPDNIALVFEDCVLTYKELNELANQLSQHLKIRYGVSQNDYVGIKLERSEKLLVAILAVLKTGAAYVPIDVNYPQERINFIEKDSDCKCLVDEGEYKRFVEFKHQYNKENHLISAHSDRIAYIIYTSGTTGNPKGVMITHPNAVAMIFWAWKEYDTEKYDVVYAPTSHCFDLSVYEMFYPLSVGKKVKIFNSALDIGTALQEDKNVLLNLVPSSIRNILDSGYSLENVTLVNLAGEPFPVDIANRLLQTSAEIRNLYGPSEDTTYSTCYKLSRKKVYKTIPIGKPIINTSAYILNEEMALVPVGVAGKLYLSGAGVTKGYLNQPELTSEKFIANPFAASEKMYDTGDIAKWMSDGNLAFLGRKDHQVKLRGYRIEPGEIEHAILSFSDEISQTVVAVKDHNNEQVLVAYYTENNPIDKSHLSQFLETILPSYTIPGYFICIKKIPLTPNGKVDKNALPPIDSTSIIKNEYLAPADAEERALIDIWEEVLGISPIGVNDDFFKLGGHSLMISQIINAIYRNLQRYVSYKVFYANPTIKQLRETLNHELYTSIPEAALADSYPVTPAQNRMWLLSQFEGASLAYNMPFAFELKGKLHIDLFEKAFNQLIHRHEIFRTYFKRNSNSGLRQYIILADQVNFKFERKDFSNEKDKATAIKNYIDVKSKVKFDLGQAPLMNASILKVEHDQHIFFINKHHIIGDGWSSQIMISEVEKIYNALTQNQPTDLPDLHIQHKDYAVWLNDSLQVEKLKVSEEYWLQQFSGELPVLELPAYKPRPLIRTYNGASISHTYSAAFLNQLKTFSQKQGATLFMTLMTGINALLYRYTSQQDLIIGTPIAGRDHPDLENQIGLFLNTLAIRTKIEKGQRFSDLLESEKSTLLNAYQHQGYPFDALIGKLNLKRDTSRSVLFDVMVVLQSQEQLKNINTGSELDDLEISNYGIDQETAQFDIRLAFIETDGLLLNIEYNTDIYDLSLVERMFVHLENLFKASFEQRDIVLEQINYLTKEEQDQILLDFNNTTQTYPKEKTVIELFEQQVKETPERTAVVFETEELTYAKLNEEATALANFIRNHHEIIVEDLIGVKLEKSEWLIVSLLAILKTGAAYVPIDLEYPPSRVAFIEKDSNCKLIIDEDLLNAFKQSERSLKEIAPPNTSSRNLAYVMYTSGSTGKPKGVMVEHRSIIRLVKSTNYYNFSLADVLLSTGSFSFDATTFEYWGTLLNGGQLILCSKEVLLDSTKLEQEIAERGVNVMWFTAGWFNQLVDLNINLFSPLKTVLAGGDRLSPAHVQELRSTYKDLEIINGYGPTENTTFSLTYNIKEISGDIPIGYPVSNSTAYILDDNKTLCPLGVVGEIYLGGDGLSRGYWNRQELTTEKFVPHPFDESTLLYKSGDLGRYTIDGKIEFMGRKDHQVKIRGNRIEPGEIDYALMQLGFHQVVSEIKELQGEKVIVAYVVAADEIDKESIRQRLKESLPGYMLPNYFVALTTMPLTPNGKVDRKSLPEIKEKDIIKKAYVAPKTKIEKDLVSIWKAVLGLEKIGTTDNFFELGGHSLKATELLAIIHKEFDVTINIQEIFKHPTIQNLATNIENAKWLETADHNQSAKKIIL